jgi:hypothetical protein
LGWTPTNGKVSPFVEGGRDVNAEMAAGIAAAEKVE